jgi:hypothetical protein
MWTRLTPGCALYCEALCITRELSSGASYLVVCLVDLQIINIFTCWITHWMAVGSVCHVSHVEWQFTTNPGRTLIILSVFVASLTHPRQMPR